MNRMNRILFLNKILTKNNPKFFKNKKIKLTIKGKLNQKPVIKFIPDPGAQTSKSTNNAVKRPNTFSQPPT